MGFYIMLSCLIVFSTCAMDEKPISLTSLVASYVATKPELVERANMLIKDIQSLVNQEIIIARIKPALFPIKFKTSKNSVGVNHHGVCGLETISKTKQIISIGCDGKIAICDENSMHNCEVINTQTNWYCASLKCEPATLCLGDLSGNIGYMGIQDKTPKPVFKAHEQIINALSLSSDQQHIISCSNDWQIKVWEIVHNKKLATFLGHTRAVKNAFSILAYQKIISAAADQTIRVWDINTSKEQQRYSMQATIFNGANFFRLAKHPHEQFAVSGLNNGIVALWDIRKSRHVDCLKGHNTVVSALICSEDGNYVASASWDGKVRLWDLRMMACSAILAYHKDWVQSVSSLHNFQEIVSGSRDGRVKIWDISSIHAVDSMNNLKETAAKAALIEQENPISNDERFEMLKAITDKPLA